MHSPEKWWTKLTKPSHTVVAKPTVNDIARVAGVSLATVDRVLNERPGVRAVTIKKVKAAIDQLGYVRDTAAANLAVGLFFVLRYYDYLKYREFFLAAHGLLMAMVMTRLGCLRWNCGLTPSRSCASSMHHESLCAEEAASQRLWLAVSSSCYRGS